MINLPWDLPRKIIPVIRKTARPTEDDVSYNVPTLWLDETNNKAYILLDVTSGVATWTQAIGASVNLDFQNSVLSIATAASAPPTEVSGNRYILSSTGTPHANWDGALNNDIVEFDGAKWVASTPTEGMYCEVEDANTIYLYITSWTAWENQATTTTSSPTFATVTANLTLPDAGKITIDVSPDSDHTATGIIASYTAGENLVYGNLCYLKSDGKWWKSDADTAATMPGMKMALATISADAAGLFLCWGVARDDSWAWTIGGMIYASTDGGGLTQTAPSGDGDQIQIVGKAKTATTIFFHPTEITAEVGLDYVDKGTADYTITMAELTAVPKTFAGNHSSDQTFTLAAPSAADAGKKFIQKKNGTGAGKLILQLPAGVTAYNAAGASSAAGTIYLAASARGTIQFTIESATSVSVDFADGTITTT